MSEDRNDVIAKVTARVIKEMSASETAFEKNYGVADLRAHLSGLGKGAESAWEISYKTSSAIDVAQALDSRVVKAAWEISYSTAAAPAVEQLK